MFHPRKYLKRIGPGVITGASDDDPSGIATYSQTGAGFGYQFLWLALFTTPLMYACQEMSARLGMVTGRGLADIIRRHVSRRTVLLLCMLLLVANTVNIGADLGAMSEATRLLVGIPAWVLLVGFAFLIILLEIFVSYRQYANILRWLTLALFSYVVAAFFTHQDWLRILVSTIVPHLTLSKEAIFLIVGVLGTTISPYLFFWQASEEVEEEIAEGKTTVRQRTDATKEEIRAMRSDTWTGMIFSNVIMFFIILTTAGTLHRIGLTHIETAGQAADALRPLAGNWSFLFFTLGIIGTGLLAIPILAGSASYAVSEVFGWREGLSRKFRGARQFYLTIAVAIVIGLFMNFLNVSPVRFLIVAAVLNGLSAPVMLWYIIRLADRTDVVGEHRSTPFLRTVAWIGWAVMTVAGAALIVQLISG